MTNWVTIRVPEADREEAKEIRPSGATHGDCLVAGARALNNVRIGCGCGDYAVWAPDGDIGIDVVCPECGNHFGQGDAHIQESDPDVDDAPVRTGGDVPGAVVDAVEETAGFVEDVHDDVKDLHVLLDRLPERTADELEARQR